MIGVSAGEAASTFCRNDALGTKPERVRRGLLPERLVVGEEEAPVLHDRAAEIAAELILR